MGSQLSHRSILPVHDSSNLQRSGEEGIWRLASAESIPVDDEFWQFELSSISVKASDIRAFDELDLAIKEEFRKNNAKSRNLNSLLRVIALELRALPRNLDIPNPWLANLVFLARSFLFYFMQNLPVEEFYAQICPEGDEDVVKEFVKALMNASAEVDVNISTDDLHLEIVKTLACLCTSQLMGNLDPSEDHLFLKVFFQQEYSDSTHKLAVRLLNNYISDGVTQLEKVSTDENSISGSSTPGLFKSLFQAIRYPFQIYQFLFNKPPVARQLANQSILLFLLLAYQDERRLQKNEEIPLSNPVFLYLSQIRDNDFGTEGDNSNIEQIAFHQVFDALTFGISVEQDPALLLFCMLLRFNTSFKEYLFVKSDIDGILLPCLETLFKFKGPVTDTVYTILIVLLILSEESEFCKTVHSRSIIPSVSWIKEPLIENISLGSLIYFTLFRVIQINLRHQSDSYLHSNCIAIMSNLSPQTTNLHQVVSQKICSILLSFGRKLKTLVEKSETEIISEDQFKGTTETEEFIDDPSTYSDFISVLLNILNFSLSEKNISGSVDLIYSLLHNHSFLAAFETQSIFSAPSSNLRLIIDLFEDKLRTINLSDVSFQEIRQIIQHNAKFSEVISKVGPLASVSFSKFHYEELPDADEFFVPYVWKSWMKSSDVAFDPENTNLIN